MDKLILVFRQPNARRKATRAAAQEALTLLGHLGAHEITGGPFGDPRGLFYLELPAATVETAMELLPLLGYTASVEKVTIVEDVPSRKRRELPRWKGKAYTLEVLYQVDGQQMRKRAPDRREFLLPTAEGTVRRVVGYRGDGGRLGRRALPVWDARLLVNLVSGKGPMRFLDPFAGAGGVILEALEHGHVVYSTDIDPTVMHGLGFLGSHHCVADARMLPFRDSSFDAIASEPPYDVDATDAVCDALPEIDRVLTPEGRVALLAAALQNEAITGCAGELRWIPEVNEEMDRKGLPVSVLSWRKP